MSCSKVTCRRRGCYVMKLAATLFLAMKEGLNTPGKGSEAMEYPWGCARLGQEYLRRTRPPDVQRASYTNQQLIKAEGQSKAALGNLAVGHARVHTELISYSLW
ncbi:hypothetical protein ABL78_3652 [Leptomonas seymouri]|uniref:Uncharacterized protein n=1 Tax=Leptomonas seymouri TaxID=5684 RepID=A0A0N0P6K1_LEPSE|nr:hypothetical protein ABL78_3652 [Leptomonas seymouri]|eukprot:KPI87257.1 hypothetical protein ABL78_3652 [Leptomonas seymouri]